MKTDVSIRFDNIDKYVRRTMETGGIPGLSIGVTDRRRTLWVRTYGCAELESKTKVTPDTLFEIGSISKFFSSMVLMQLRDERLIDLHKPVTEYLPWFKVRSRFRPITLHHLLTHTAGLVVGQEESPEGVPEVWALRGTEASTPPGEHFHYSNHGYKTIGLVMERITGKTCGQLVTERVLRPQGMTSTEALITNQVRDRLAVGYAPFMDDRPFLPGDRLAPATWFESGTADGTICSTPGDMCKHLRMLLRGGASPGGRLVSEAGFALMITPHIKPEDNVHGESYGYGMNVGKIDGNSCLWHTGGMVGFNASIVADVDAGIGIVTMVNGPGAPEEVSLYALKAIRASLEGARPPAVPTMHRVRQIENPGQYSGSYSSASGKLKVVASRKSLWILRGGDRSRLEPSGPDMFCTSGGNDLYPYRFGRDKGEVVELFHGRDWYVNNRYHGPRRFAGRRTWTQFVGHYRSNSPWTSNFRIVLRKGQLALIEPQGGEKPLVPLGSGVFRIGADPRCPERIEFGMILDGKAYMAVRSAGRCYRTFTP